MLQVLSLDVVQMNDGPCFTHKKAQQPVDYCHWCIRRNPSCFCEHGFYFYKGNQMDVCAECDADAEAAVLEAKAAAPPAGHEWDSDPESELMANLEDSDLERQDEEDLANSENEDTQDEEFVVHEGEEAAPAGLAAQLARGYEPDLEFEDQGEDEPIEAKGPRPSGAQSAAEALAEVERFWVQERFAPARRAEVIRQYRLIEQLPEADFADEDIAFMLDAQFFLGDRDEDVAFDMAQAENDAALRGVLKKKRFRFQGRAALLTYIAVEEMSLEAVVELIRAHNWHGLGVGEQIYEAPKFSVGMERAPTTGKLHFHVFLDFRTKMNILGKRRYRLKGFGDPNIKTVTKAKYRDTLEYTMKGGTYMFSHGKEAWLPNNSRGFKTAKENHELWKQQLHQAKQRSPFPMTLLGPDSKVLREPKPQDKKRHWVIKSAPDAGKSWWAHTVAAGAAVFFPRKGNKYPLEGTIEESGTLMLIPPFRL